MIDLHSNNFLGNGKRPFHVFRITVSMFKSRSAKGKPSWQNKAVGESFLIWHDQFVQEIMFHWPMCQFPKGSRHAFKSCLSKKSAKSVSSVERICRLNDIYTYVSMLRGSSPTLPITVWRKHWRRFRLLHFRTTFGVQEPLFWLQCSFKLKKKVG